MTGNTVDLLVEQALGAGTAIDQLKGRARSDQAHQEAECHKLRMESLRGDLALGKLHVTVWRHDQQFV